MKRYFLVGIDKTYIHTYPTDTISDIVQRAVDLAISKEPRQWDVNEPWLLTIHETSALVGLSTSRLYCLIREQKLKAIMHRGKLHIIRPFLRIWFKESGRTSITHIRKANGI